MADRDASVSSIPCPVSAWRRLQVEFQKLVDEDIDPTIAMIHVRKDCWQTEERPDQQCDDETYLKLTNQPLDWRNYRKAAAGRPLRFRDWAWELAPREIQLTMKPEIHGLRGDWEGDEWCGRTLGLWTDPTDQDVGVTRQWFTYAPPNDRKAIDAIAERAALIVVDMIGTSQFGWLHGAMRCVSHGVASRDSLPDLPAIYSLGSFGGTWRDIVCHFALRCLPIAPVPIAVDLRDFIGTPQFRELRRTDWFGPDRPAYFTATIPRMCRASIDVIDAIIDGWDRVVAGPGTNVAPPRAMAFSTPRTPKEWRQILKCCNRPNSDSSWRKFRDEFRGVPDSASGSKLVRFPISELGRAGVCVPELG